MRVKHLVTHFKNSVLNQPECIYNIVFHFHTHNAKENIFNEKKYFSIFFFFFFFW